VAVLLAFLRYSKWGKAMRAMSDNPDLARLCGVDNDRVTRLTWFIVGALAAASGFCLGINTELTTMMGWSAMLSYVRRRGCWAAWGAWKGRWWAAW